MVKPLDLIDDAKAQVTELRGIVRSSITAGSASVDNNIYDVYMVRDQAMEEARIDFQQERDTLLGELQTLESLGETAGVDVTACTDSEKDRINNLLNTLNDELNKCLAFSNQEVTIIQNDAYYYMSTKMTYVEVFNFQIDYCRGDFLCVSPILERVELAMVEIPEEIGVEANKAGELCDDLKVLVKQCTDDRKSDMVAEGSIYVSDASSCVNKLLP